MLDFASCGFKSDYKDTEDEEDEGGNRYSLHRGGMGRRLGVKWAISLIRPLAPGLSLRSLSRKGHLRWSMAFRGCWIKFPRYELVCEQWLGENHDADKWLPMDYIHARLLHNSSC